MGQLHGAVNPVLQHLRKQLVGMCYQLANFIGSRFLPSIPRRRMSRSTAGAPVSEVHLAS